MAAATATSALGADRKAETRRRWLATLAQFKRDADAPGSSAYWSPSLDCASRDELAAIQNAKLAAAVPFLYENSAFYRQRFERFGLIPDDIRDVGDLSRWPVVDKREMMADVEANPPFGTYATMDEATWGERGWMLFASSGSTGTPRVFRYSQIDRDMWAWANARAMHAMGIAKGDTCFLVSGFGPHVWLWGVEAALAKMQIPMIPGGGMDVKARARIIQRFSPTVLACTPSYALYLGRAMQEQGQDPAQSSIRTIFTGGEPAAGIPATRARLQQLWNARIVEFYGCTEASPHVGGYSCRASDSLLSGGGPITTHLMEDVQIWELINSETRQPVADGTRGLTVCTNLNTEGSPQLRFLVGDYTVYDRKRCACGRTHLRAVGCFSGRADDLIAIRGLKMYPAQIEEAVRGVPGIGDEYEILLETRADGLDVMTIRVEHEDQSVAVQIADEVRSRCELRVGVAVLARGTLPKTEFKAKRVHDLRNRGAS